MQIYYNIIDHILMLYIISLRIIYFTAGDLYLLISYTYFTQPLSLWRPTICFLFYESVFTFFFVFNMVFLFSVWLIPFDIISSSSIYKISFLFMAEECFMMCVCVCACVCVFVCIPLVLYPFIWKVYFAFLRNFHTVFHSDAEFTISPTMY